MITQRREVKMGFWGSSLAYGLILVFLVCLLYPPTSPSVIRQCISRHNGPHCSKEEELAYDCILRSINNSLDPLDVRTKLTTNVEVWKSNQARFCAKWSKISDPVKDCVNKQRVQCKPTDTSSADLCGRGGLHCFYHKYATCSIKVGMLYGKFVHDMQSDICIETDLNRRLLPPYGPHLKCYEDIADYSVDVRFPLDHYLQFCQRFDSTKLKNCIDAKLAPLSSDALATDKNQFANAAKSFLRETKQFCDSLSKIEDSFLTKCRMQNALGCMKEAFDPKTNKSGYYISCISKHYSKCHAPIGAILMNNGFTSMPSSVVSLITFHLFFNLFLTSG